MGKLSARRAATAPPGKYCDGHGLWLVVTARETRYWVYRFNIGGKRREMGLGKLFDVSLAQARRKALEARRMVLDGVDPIEERRRRKIAPPTFTSAAARYIVAHRRGWSNLRHGRQWASTIRRFARPVLGDVPVDRITTEHVLEVLKPIWLERTITAKRVQSRIESILDYCGAMRWRDPVNPARWRGHLDKLLPKPTRVAKIRHFPAMPYAQLPAFLVELRRVEGNNARALEWLILSATRTNETMGARWSEIDAEGRVWTVPASRAKAKREHRVPLTTGLLDLLERLPVIEEEPFLFFGARSGRPVNKKALLELMAMMGYCAGGVRGDYVPHGFRSSFRDWAGETTTHPRDVCEMALGHSIPNKAEAAYRRGDLFEKRRVLMEDWSAWCLSET